MGDTFLDFIAKRKSQAQNIANITEAFKTADADKAVDIISDILKKHINNLLPLEGYVQTTVDGQSCLSKQYIVMGRGEWEKTSMFQFNWLVSETTTNVYSITFFKDMDFFWNGTGKADLELLTMGSSVVYMLPIVWTVVNRGDYKLTKAEAMKIAKGMGEIKESKYYIGALEYTLLEGLSDNIIKDTFMLEAKLDPEANKFKVDMKQKAMDATDAARKNPNKETRAAKNDAWHDYQSLLNAIRGGATTLEELQLAVKRNVTVNEIEETGDADQQQAVKEIEAVQKKRKDPDQVFKEMAHYVKMVIKGLQNSVIICGAPGVGKTFNVKQLLKANGYVEGHNLTTIKGKCTPRELYVALYDKKRKGDIVLIDDADALVGPKAPEDCINILKAALDSTDDDEGRLVSYRVSGKILDMDGNEIEKTFYYNGAVIILTNWNAGSLDTALRGRSFIQDINFNVEEMLSIIKKKMPYIEPKKYSAKSKMKAYSFLCKLNEEGAKMEISLRTFGHCALLYQSVETIGDDFTNEELEDMIRTQMEMYASRNKAKY